MASLLKVKEMLGLFSLWWEQKHGDVVQNSGISCNNKLAEDAAQICDPQDLLSN